jgi:hypothetical protein
MSDAESELAGFARICAPTQRFSLNFRAGDVNNRAAEAPQLTAHRGLVV